MQKGHLPLQLQSHIHYIGILISNQGQVCYGEHGHLVKSLSSSSRSQKLIGSLTLFDIDIWMFMKSVKWKNARSRPPYLQRVSLCSLTDSPLTSWFCTPVFSSASNGSDSWLFFLPVYQTGSAAAHICTGTPRCKSGSWSVCSQIPRRSHPHPPPQ